MQGVGGGLEWWGFETTASFAFVGVSQERRRGKILNRWIWRKDQIWSGEITSCHVSSAHNPTTSRDRNAGVLLNVFDIS